MLKGSGMCWDCFKQYADAPVINDRVVAVYRQIAARDGDADYSSLLHLSVSDMNVEDDWFAFDADGNESLRQRYDAAEPWERDIFDALAALSEAERATAIAMDWGYFDEAGALRADRATRSTGDGT